MGVFNAEQPPANGWNTLTIPVTVNSQQAGGYLKVIIARGPGGVQTVVDNVRAEIVRAAAGMPGIPSAPAASLFTLQSSAGGNGALSRDPNDAAYASGTVVQLTTSPAAGYQLDHWSGDATGKANPLPLTINAPISVTANFTLNLGIYEGWSIQKMTSIQNTADDFDGDGASNLQEYFFGSVPATPDVEHLPTVSLLPDGRLQLTYRRNTLATDLTYTVQGANDPGNAWQPLLNPLTEDLGTDNGVQILRVTDTTDPGARRFLRLFIQK